MKKLHCFQTNLRHDKSLHPPLPIPMQTTTVIFHPFLVMSPQNQRHHSNHPLSFLPRRVGHKTTNKEKTTKITLTSTKRRQQSNPPSTSTSKTMKLPSPTSVTNQFDNLSFKSNTKHGWQKVGKESISGVCGCVNASLGFPESFYIDSNGRILRTNFFGSGAIGSTVGDGGSPQGSTELDTEAGYNCELPRKQHRLYCTIVCALDPKGYGIRRNNNNAYNTKLNDLYCLINTIPTRGSNIPGDREHMAVGLARFCFHYIGSKALTQAIIDEVWQERAIELGGERGDLEIIRRRAICDCSISINLLHIWSAPDDENQQILGDTPFLTPPTQQNLQDSPSRETPQLRQGTHLHRRGNHLHPHG